MTEDLEDGDGDEIRASELDTRSGVVNLGFEPTDALRLELGGIYYDDEGLTPPNANAAASATTEVERDITTVSGRLGVEFAPEGSDLIDVRGSVYITDVALEEDRLADGRFDTTDFQTIGLDLANTSAFQLGLPVTLTYGVEAYQDSQEGTRNGADRLQFPDADLTFLAGFVQAEVAVTDRVTVTPGVRFDHYSLDPTGVDADGDALDDRSEGQLSPRLAVSVEATEQLTLWARPRSPSARPRSPSYTTMACISPLRAFH